MLTIMWFLQFIILYYPILIIDRGVGCVYFAFVFADMCGKRTDFFDVFSKVIEAFI